MDLERHLAAVPEKATCKGMFFGDVIAASRAHKEQFPHDVRKLLRRRYVPFMDYPLVDHMQITGVLSQVLFGGLPTREAMRRLGWLAYPTFASSTVGKVTLGFLGVEPDNVLDVAPKSIALSVSPGAVQSQRCGERDYLLEFSDIYGFLDSYYVGVVEGALRHYSRAPIVSVSMQSICDGHFRVSW